VKLLVEHWSRGPGAFRPSCQLSGAREPGFKLDCSNEHRSRTTNFPTRDRLELEPKKAGLAWPRLVDRREYPDGWITFLSCSLLSHWPLLSSRLVSPAGTGIRGTAAAASARWPFFLTPQHPCSSPASLHPQNLRWGTVSRRLWSHSRASHLLRFQFPRPRPPARQRPATSWFYCTRPRVIMPSMAAPAVSAPSSLRISRQGMIGGGPSALCSFSFFFGGEKGFLFNVSLCCLVVELKVCYFLLLVIRDLTQQLMLFNVGVGQGWGERCRYGSRSQRAIRGATVSARASMVRHASTCWCDCDSVSCVWHECVLLCFPALAFVNFTWLDGVQQVS